MLKHPTSPRLLSLPTRPLPGLSAAPLLLRPHRTPNPPFTTSQGCFIPHHTKALPPALPLAPPLSPQTPCPRHGSRSTPPQPSQAHPRPAPHASSDTQNPKTSRPFTALPQGQRRPQQRRPSPRRRRVGHGKMPLGKSRSACRRHRRCRVLSHGRRWLCRCRPRRCRSAA